MRSNPELNRSPFFHRNYGGFTHQQKEFYESIIKIDTVKTVLDPMAGQGYLLSKLCRDNFEVWLGDINPAPLFLASLRDPKFIVNRDWIYKYTNNFLANLASVPEARENIRYKYEDGWIIDPIRHDLEKYAGFLEIASIFDFGNLQNFCQEDIFKKFLAFLPILAARELTTYHESDNKTWLMPGGLIRETGIIAPLTNALEKWYEYANNIANQNQTGYTNSSLNVSYMNVEHGDFGLSPNPDAIVTSPPYANRLDYTRMWYPEMVVSSILFNIDIRKIKDNQIGSTVVSKKQFSIHDIYSLPTKTQDALEEIRKDRTSKASETYYYPFFANYAISLRKALINLGDKLRDGGYLIIFIRDTVRKDVLFSASTLVEDVLKENCKFSHIRTNNEIIRNHVGLLRNKGLKPSVYGIAQRESWLAYKKG